jgi:hypothetical protein
MIRQFASVRSTERVNRCRHACHVGLFACPTLAITFTEKIGRDQYMHRRMLLPIAEQIINFPQSKLVDLREGPPGSGCNVAVNKRPLG